MVNKRVFNYSNNMIFQITLIFVHKNFELVIVYRALLAKFVHPMVDALNSSVLFFFFVVLEPNSGKCRNL